MALFKILGVRNFAKKEDIKKYILENYNFSDFEDKEEFASESSLLFFQSRRQQTSLFFTNSNIYCVLDDISSDTFQIRWNIPKHKVVSDYNEIILNIKIDPDYNEISGHIDFGDLHRGWLYSKKLYPLPDLLLKDIKSLIKISMIESSSNNKAKQYR